MVSAYAPGKAILFGEHAVVYGHPAVAVAISKGVQVSLSGSDSWTVGNRPLCPNRHPHLNWLVERNNLTDRPMSIKISSELFPAAGQGSSAALSVAAQLALAEFSGLSTDTVDAAITAHQAEAYAQFGRASPTDTATSSLGGCVVVSNNLSGTADTIFRASLETPEGVMEWDIGTVDLTYDDMPHIVLGHSGAPSQTGKMVSMVAELISENQEKKQDLDFIGELTLMGLVALRSGAWEAVGMAMDVCHEKLRSLGLSTPVLETLIEAVRPHSLGAKLTGSGGGGCMMALTYNPERVAQTIELSGGRAIITPMHCDGARVLKS